MFSSLTEISQRIFRVALLFICQGAFVVVFDTQLVYIIMRSNSCQQLFLIFFSALFVLFLAVELHNTSITIQCQGLFNKR